VILVVGSAHLDILSRRVPVEGFRGDVDKQVWVESEALLGGVGVNLARSVIELQKCRRVCLIAVVGDDAVGRFVTSLFSEALTGVECSPLSISEVQTGIVSLIWLGDSDNKTRVVLAPEMSAIDAVMPSSVDSRVNALACGNDEPIDLFLDGYLFRGSRLRAWLPTLASWKHHGIRTHIVLVPHSIWTELDEEVFLELLDVVSTVDASMFTVLNIFGGKTSTEDAEERLASRLRDTSGVLRLRYGRKNVELCRVYHQGTYREIHYPAVEIGADYASQDRLLVREVLLEPTDLC
jgi:sugar/nucleoside kinase (ribokinase family)